MSLSEVPVEILLDSVLPCLPLSSIIALSLTCRTLYQLVNDEVLWQTLTLRDFNVPWGTTFRQVGWKRLYSKLLDPIVFTWGEGAHARLGHPAVPLSRSANYYRNESSPRELLSLRGKGIVDIVAGGWSFHALDRNGNVWMWGTMSGSHNSNHKQPTLVNLPVPVRSISSGRHHAMALGKDGRLFKWVDIRKPVEIVAQSFSPIVQVAAGWGFGAALAANGNIFYISDDDVGDEEDEPLRKAINAYVNLDDIKSASYIHSSHDLGTKFKKIACGEAFMIALTDTGKILKFDTTTKQSFLDPRNIQYLARFTFNTGEPDTATSKKAIGHVSAFFREFAAYNREGAVLWGDKDCHAESMPILFPELKSSICQISIADWHKGAITNEGKLLTWGELSHGALGHTTAKAKPTILEGELADKFVFAIGFGGWQSGALAVDLNVRR